ncbi:MAG TPA: alpha-L-fucosidase [Bryobacteraceae bacterium]|jgi:alpha-L-fucosidase
MQRRDFLRTMAAAPLALRQSAGETRYQANWDSLDSRPTPEWYLDAKFGIFIHWGVYSVPSFAPPRTKGETPYAEWYWHSLTEGKKETAPGQDGYQTWQFHRRVYGADFPYFDFAPQFRAEMFDPDHWADVIAGSGARYVVPTSKHHEGFTLWRSAEANRDWGRPWNAVDIGPRRDLLADLTNAGRKRGLHMGIYYSLYEWYNPLWLSDKPRYVREHLFPQFQDVVKHVEPEVIFSDGEWELTSEEWHSPELLAWLFNESPVRGRVVINDRWGKDTRHKHGGYYTTEYTSGMTQGTHPWEESRGMGFSYGYNRAETLADYHTGRDLLMMLIDLVSRGGNLLLDIGPTGDGRIPVIMEERLSQLGDWLKQNGEAIYGTRAWRRARQWSEGAEPKLQESEFMSAYPIASLVDTPPAGAARIEAFFTAKGDVVYAILPHRPEREVVLDDIETRTGVRVTMLGSAAPLEVRHSEKHLMVSVPEALPFSQAYVLKLEGVA